MSGENTPLLQPPPQLPTPSSNSFEKIAFYINLVLGGICLVILIVLSGVKAWCSTAVILVISGIYFTVPVIINKFFPQLKETFTLSGMSLPVGILFIMCYLVVIALCVGFGQIDIKQPTKTTIYAAQNGALFMIIVLLIILIPGSVNLFGNTVGYWIVSSFYNVEINEIIRPLLININDIIKQNTDCSFMITLDTDNINETIQKINDNPTDNLPRIIGLKQYIQQKNSIGHLMWVSLASIATVITTLSGRTLSTPAAFRTMKI